VAGMHARKEITPTGIRIPKVADRALIMAIREVRMIRAHDPGLEHAIGGVSRCRLREKEHSVISPITGSAATMVTDPERAISCW
jgi:hypothetical protein